MKKINTLELASIVMMEIIAANDYSDDNQIVYLMIKDIGKSNL